MIIYPYMFDNKNEVEVDKEKINDLLTRGVSAIYPTKEKLEEKLLSGQKIRIYAGADATGPSIHLGHTKILHKLEKLRQMGHEVIVLFGDFTAKIGDPTDKKATRVRLTDEEIQNNLKNWKEQISKIINLDDKKNPAKIVFNSEWLSKMNLSDVVDITANFTVQQMIERDMFEQRIKEGKPIYLHEFLYPMMQGYDSVHLDVDLEIGGSDQTFNMLAGRTLLSKLKEKEKFVLVVELIEDPKTGKKLMSKSEGDAIWLDDSANEMFGKILALSDDSIIPMMISTTLLETKEIKKFENDLKKGVNPKEIKIILAKEVVKIYHGEKEAEEAEKNFQKTFSNKESMPNDVVKLSVTAESILVDSLIKNEIVSSKSEWRRLVNEGAVKDLKSAEKITDPNQIVRDNLDLKIGKKKFVKVIVVM
jgi:tyrosyl-tRNA synthetase